MTKGGSSKTPNTASWSFLPKFSLLTLVLAITIVALVVGLLRSAQRNTTLQTQNQILALKNKEYRNELGIFEIEDPQKIHVIRIPTESPRKYRVYLPPGRQYVQCYSYQQVHSDGVSKPDSKTTISSGTYVFSVELSGLTNRETGEPTSHAKYVIRRQSTDDANDSSTSHVAVRNWMVDRETGKVSYGWNEPERKLALHAPEEPLVIYRARAQNLKVLNRDQEGKVAAWTTEPREGPCDGFMLWIEPAE